MSKITVQNTEVTVIKVDGEDCICLTDMLLAKDGDFFITDWLRNRIVIPLNNRYSGKGI